MGGPLSGRPQDVEPATGVPFASRTGSVQACRVTVMHAKWMAFVTVVLAVVVSIQVQSVATPWGTTSACSWWRVVMVL
jgi:hypothetical protein